MAEADGGIPEYTWAITLLLGTPCGLAFVLTAAGHVSNIEVQCVRVELPHGLILSLLTSLVLDCSSESVRTNCHGDPCEVGGSVCFFYLALEPACLTMDCEYTSGNPLHVRC